VFLLNLLLLGGRHDNPQGDWQGLGFVILPLIDVYIGWLSKPFFTTKEGFWSVDFTWVGILTLMISLGACMVVDFLLRRFVWHKVGKSEGDSTIL
jgi:hypothetical protein